jgi:hypothetical protein
LDLKTCIKVSLQIVMFPYDPYPRVVALYLSKEVVELFKIPVVVGDRDTATPNGVSQVNRFISTN